MVSEVWWDRKAGSLIVSPTRLNPWDGSSATCSLDLGAPMNHLAFPSTSPPRDQCGPLPLAVAGVQAWGGSELGTHALQSVRVVHCSGCPYLRLAASPHVQQPGRGEPDMYPEPGIKCALEWRSPVYRGCGGGLMGNRNAWLYLPALSPQLVTAAIWQLAAGVIWQLVGLLGPPGHP